MKKVLLLTALAGISFASMAQFSFAPKVGVGLTSSSFTEGSTSAPSSSAINFNLGLEARYRLNDMLSIHSGLFYDNIQSKNATTQTVLGTTFSDAITNKMSFISLPLELVYGKDGVGFYGGAGFNFAYGISGTATEVENDGTGATTTSADIKFDGTKNADDNNEHLNGFNVGIALKAGYAFTPNIFAGVDAIIGLSNLSPNDNSSYKLTTYGIHIGYLLGSSSGAKE